MTDYASLEVRVLADLVNRVAKHDTIKEKQLRTIASESEMSFEHAKHILVTGGVIQRHSNRKFFPAKVIKVR